MVSVRQRRKIARRNHARDASRDPGPRRSPNGNAPLVKLQRGHARIAFCGEGAESCPGVPAGLASERWKALLPDLDTEDTPLPRPMPQADANPGASPSAVPAELGAAAVWRWPLDRIERRDLRLMARLTARLALVQVQTISNWQRLLPQRDPFILVANHGSRREAVFLSALCLLIRSGKPVRFLADWNFRLIPGVGYFYDHSGAILVTTKSARPRLLNRLKPRFARQGPPFDQARAALRAGGAVGVFPEGTVNRDAKGLLRGRYGAARLSLELGVPLLPVGLRFLGPPRSDGRSDSSAPLHIEVGSPMAPAQALDSPTAAEVRAWHRQMMNAIAALCGKPWTGTAPLAEDPHGADTTFSVAARDKRARGGSVC